MQLDKLKVYVVKPTGADNPSQHGRIEKWNDTLGITVRVLLYSSRLPGKYWSAALLHAVYLHNRRVHKAIGRTPFEAWYGLQPNLKHLKLFSSWVCIRRTGKCRAKLDTNTFKGILLGYAATDHSICYIDVNSGIVKRSVHAIFDEAWYSHPTRPPTA